MHRLPSCFIHQSPCYHPTSYSNIFNDNTESKLQVVAALQSPPTQQRCTYRRKRMQNNPKTITTRAPKCATQMEGETMSLGWGTRIPELPETSYLENITKGQCHQQSSGKQVTGVDTTILNKENPFLCFVLNGLEQNRFASMATPDHTGE